MKRKDQESPEVLILTGLSGSGRSVALKTLEDMGYEAIDNLPLYLLEAVCFAKRPSQQPLAVGVDVRSHGFSPERFDDFLNKLKKQTRSQLFFLDADNAVLEQRFRETRRRHPLADDKPLLEGILLERKLLRPFREEADQLIDTSLFSSSDLKKYLRETLDPHRFGELLLMVNSFSYARGIPREADILHDMRFLENPHYIPELSALTGEDPAVQDFIRKDPVWTPFEEQLKETLRLTLPRYKKEGRKYIYLGFGCTGGQHRSVFAALTFAKWLHNEEKYVKLNHRELIRKLS